MFPRLLRDHRFWIVPHQTMTRTWILTVGRLTGAVALVPLVLACAPQQAVRSAAAPPPGLPPLLDRAVFFGQSEISGQPQLSPDGRFIAILRPLNGVRNLWVMRAGAPLDSARPVTASTTVPVRAMHWTPGGMLLFASDRHANLQYHIHGVDPAASVDPATGVPPARHLTPGEGLDARVLAIPRTPSDWILIRMREAGRNLWDVHRVNTRTGERQLVFRNDLQIGEWLADQEANLRVARKQREDGVWEVLSLEGDTLRPVYRCGVTENCTPMHFHRDGRRIYLRTNRDSDLARLVLLDLATGEAEVVAEDPEGRADLEVWQSYSRATGELAAAVYNDEEPRWYAADPAFGRVYDRVQERLRDLYVSPIHDSADGRFWLLGAGSSADPGGTYLYDRDRDTLTLLFRARPELAVEHMAESRGLRYRARDGVEVPAYLTLPRGAEPRSLPLVVMPHGGPAWRTWPGYSAWAQFLANRGYAVLDPNFRGSIGYGKTFLNLGNREWGGRSQDDISDGVRWLVEQGIADPERVAILGQSGGGFAALAGLAFTPELYAAGVSLYGQSNLLTFIDAIRDDWGPDLPALKLWLGDPDDPADRERLRARSPLFSAERIRAPLLVAQGANDALVPQAESDQIVARLRELDREADYLLAAGEGHGWREEANRLALSAAIEHFLAEHLGGRAQEEIRPDVAARLEQLRRYGDQAVESNLK